MADDGTFRPGSSISFDRAAEVCPSDIGCIGRCQGKQLPAEYKHLGGQDNETAWVQFATEGCCSEGFPCTSGSGADTIRDDYMGKTLTKGAHPGGFSNYERGAGLHTDMNKVLPGLASYTSAPNYKSIATSSTGVVGMAHGHPTQGSATAAALASCHRTSGKQCKETYRGDVYVDNIPSKPIKNVVFLHRAESVTIQAPTPHPSTFGSMGPAFAPGTVSVRLNKPSQTISYTDRPGQLGLDAYKTAGNAAMLYDQLSKHSHTVKEMPRGIIATEGSNGAPVLMGLSMFSCDFGPDGALDMLCRMVSPEEASEIMCKLTPQIQPSAAITLLNAVPNLQLPMTLKNPGFFFR